MPAAPVGVVVAEQDDIAALGFEDALKRLEAIVRRLEAGDAPLDTAIDLYSEAQALKQHCETKLSAAEARIAQLQLAPDGTPTGSADFPG